SLSSAIYSTLAVSEIVTALSGFFRRAGAPQESPVVDLPPMDVLIFMSIRREIQDCFLPLRGIGNCGGRSPGLPENRNNLDERGAAGQGVTAARRHLADRGKINRFVIGVGFNKAGKWN